MKPNAFMFVVVADQVDSRTSTDRVPDALDRLAGLSLELPFERTAGDEIQGLASDPGAVVEAVVGLTRLRGWRIGIGAGEVDRPLPESTRAARGSAYLAAREAIRAARHSPTDLALALAPGVPADRYGELATDAETALWLLRSVLSRRSQEGWELTDLLDQGFNNARAAERLGVSPSAVSQRLARAGRTEATRGAELAARLLGRLRELAERPELAAGR